MRGMGRVAALASAIAIAAGGSVAGYMLSAGSAKADVYDSCYANIGNGSLCKLDDTISNVASIWLQTTQTLNEITSTNLTWTATCDGTTTSDNNVHGVPPYVVHVYDGWAHSCTVQVSFQVVFGKGSVNQGSVIPTGWVFLDDTPQSEATASPTPSAAGGGGGGTASGTLVRGYHGKCLDDAKNSSSLRAKVVIWNCSNGDRAQKWTYSAGEIKHNGLCLNAKGSGASGSTVILWTCNGAPNEIWVYNSLNNQLLLRAHGFQNCLTDPGYSTKNGTQLTVSACRNTANQHWSKP